MLRGRRRRRRRGPIERGTLKINMDVQNKERKRDTQREREMTRNPARHSRERLEG